MKLKDIEVGKLYAVKVPQNEDVALWHVQHYDGVQHVGVVTEIGVHNHVPEYITYGGIAGTPRVVWRTHESKRADYVRVKVGDRIVTIRGNNVLWPMSGGND